MSTVLDQLIDVKSACTLIGLSKQSLYRMIESGQIRSVRVGPAGRKVRIVKADVERYLADIEAQINGGGQ